MTSSPRRLIACALVLLAAPGAVSLRRGVFPRLRPSHRLQAAGSGDVDSTLDALRTGLPFLSEGAAGRLAAADIEYDGLLVQCRGRKNWVDLLRSRGRDLEKRVEQLQVRSNSLAFLGTDFDTQVTNVRHSWEASFIAKLPPPAMARLDEVGETLPGGKIQCCVTVQSDFAIDRQGRIISQKDELIQTYDLRNSIEATEFLLAMRPKDQKDPVTWYVRVLRSQTKGEWDNAGVPTVDGKSFELAFASVLLRQFAFGSFIGGIIYIAAKILKVALIAADPYSNAPGL